MSNNNTNHTANSWYKNQHQQYAQVNHQSPQIYYNQNPQQPPPPPLPQQPISYPLNTVNASYPFLPPPNQMYANYTYPNSISCHTSSYPHTLPSNNNSVGIYGTPQIPQYQQQSIPSYPFLPHSSPSANQRPNKKSKPNQLQALSCPSCNNQQFPNTKALLKHQSTHKTCTFPNCTFTASPKYLSLHYSTNHNGKYSGRGLKPVTIQLPGSKTTQTFHICVGNHPDDIKLWIEERKKNFPTRKKLLEKINKKSVEKGKDKEKSVIASLVSGYSSSESDTESPKTPSSPIESQVKTKLCKYYQKGKCIHGDKCKFLHDKNESSIIQPKQHKPKNKKKQSLLEKMVHSEIQRENYLTLQCLQFLMDEKLLD